MTAYVIAQLRFTDLAAYNRYQAKFFGVFKKFNGRVLAADDKPQVLEGQWDRNKIVVMSFPDRDEALRFVNDPEYNTISQDRRAGADTLSLLVEGLPAR